MVTFQGRVIVGQIRLDPPKQLPEGARVTILIQEERLPADPEAALEQELMAEGLISFHSKAYATEDFLAYCPIEIRGKPLSETITEERR